VNSGALTSLLQVLHSEHKMNKLLGMASLENNTITNSQTSEPRWQRVTKLLLNEMSLYSNLPRKQVRQSRFRYYHILCKKQEILLLAACNKGLQILNRALRALPGVSKLCHGSECKKLDYTQWRKKNAFFFK